MIPIAGVLLLIIVVFTVAIVVSNPEVFTLSIFGAEIPVTTSGVYFTGAGAMLVLILAAALLRRGLKREMARRKHVRALQTAAGVKKLPISGPGARSGAGAQATARPSTPAAVPPAEGADRSSAPIKEEAEAPNQTRTGSRTPEASTPQSQSETSPAERQALLEEAEELTGDSADR